MSKTADIVIIGSGIGGASLAATLATTGKNIVILERGDYLRDSAEARDDVAIFQHGHYRSTEEWQGTDGKNFLANNYYYVGGNSKFFGAVMFRYRKQDFAARPHLEGSSPGWPMQYEDFAPWYDRAEKMFRVRGTLNQDPTEPEHDQAYAYPPVPDEPSIALIRQRLQKAGVNPSSLPLALDIDAWLKRAKTGWDAFPNTGEGKVDAEVGPLREALKHPNVTLITNARVVRLETEALGQRVTKAVYFKDGIENHISADTFAVAAGAVQTAALLLRSANAVHPTGLANSSDQLGRNFMNHNTSAMLALDRRHNSSVYQKTLTFNDFYNENNEYGAPLGNVQLLGRVTGNILKANFPIPAPRWLIELIAQRAYGWFLTSEDLPHPDSRIMLKNDQVLVNWVRSNMQAHYALIKKTKQVMRKAGFFAVLTHTFGRKTTSHQCGTARLGRDAATSVVDLNCKSHDIDNLYIVDASVLPTSAAVNPALTIAALSIKAGTSISR